MKYVFPPIIVDRAQVLINICRSKHIRISTVESCTGGLLSACLTDIAGSSSVLDRGFVTYSNEAKHQELDVNLKTIDENGAVSDPVARRMCDGALSRKNIDAAVSLTGIAGPDGGTVLKPVGLVYIGIGILGKESKAYRYIFDGDRIEIRTAAMEQALDLLTTAVVAIE